VRDAVRAFLISFSFLVLASPAAYGSTGFAFLAATIQIVVVVIILVVTWDRIPEPRLASGGIRKARAPERTVGALAAAVAAGVLLFVASRAWLSQIIRYPIDVRNTDMLTLVEYGVRRMLHGQNPYTTYYLPWKTTLSYGPLLWGPYIAPYLLHADLRFVALIGELVVPAACALCAVALASDGRIVSAAAWIGALAFLTFDASVFDFVPIAHTPVYWPLIALFAWLVGSERWYAAAVVCGLLIVARTTMVSIAPVLLIAIWHRDRTSFLVSAILLAACALAPFVPFAVWDWPALRYAMYGAYQVVMKGFVWKTTGARDTIGLTGLLLRMGGGSLVEPAQLMALAGVYIAAWFAVGRGRRPLPWMVLALFTFSATTLWPVVYIYYDVLLLAVCAALAETPLIEGRAVGPVRTTWTICTIWTGTLAIAVLATVAVAWLDIPLDPAIDIGTAGSRRMLYEGFADDEMAERSFTWVDGRHAEILVPRRSWRDAEIDFVCEPNLPTPAATQEMSVVLNDVLLGTFGLREGWQTVTLAAPSRAWRIGVNELTMSFTNAISPLESGLSTDARKLSVAFDRLTVRTK
jgi:hypothetical protein